MSVTHSVRSAERSLLRAAAVAAALALTPIHAAPAFAEPEAPAKRELANEAGSNAYLEAGDALGLTIFAPQLRGEAAPRTAAEARAPKAGAGVIAADRAVAAHPTAPAR